MIPKAARSIVWDVIQRAAPLVGEQLISVVRQQNPELDDRDVPDAGAETEDAHEAAQRRLKELEDQGK